MSEADAPTSGTLAGREFTTDDYFNTQTPPAGLEEKTKRMHDFIQKWAAVPDKKLVVVTVSTSFLASGELRRWLLAGDDVAGSRDRWWRGAAQLLRNVKAIDRKRGRIVIVVNDKRDRLACTCQAA